MTLGALLAIVSASARPSLAMAAFPGHDGKIAFERNGSIYTMDADGGNQLRLTSGQDPSFSAGGRRIVFARIVNHPGIYVMNANGTGVRRITTHGRSDDQPAFSPNGRQIVFCRRTPGRGRAGTGVELELMDASGKHIRAIGHSAGDVDHPSFSPGGKEIVFAVEGVNPGIYVTNSHGTDQRQLTPSNDPNLYQAVQPDFSPNGKEIAFADSFIGSIYVMRANGSHLHSVLNPPKSDFPNQSFDYGNPSFSPDGKQIAVDLSRVYDNPQGLPVDGSGVVDSVNADGSQLRQIAVGAATSPSWGAG